MYRRRQVFPFLLSIVLALLIGCTTSPQNETEREPEPAQQEKQTDQTEKPSVSEQKQKEPEQTARTEQQDQPDNAVEKTREEPPEKPAFFSSVFPETPLYPTKTEKEQFGDVPLPKVEPVEEKMAKDDEEATGETAEAETKTGADAGAGSAEEAEGGAENGDGEAGAGEKTIPAGMKKFLAAVSVLQRGKTLLQQVSLAMLKEQNAELAKQNAIMEEELLAALKERSESVETAKSGGGTETAGEPEEDEEEIRHVYAVPKDVIAVTLNGNGWVFTGEQSGLAGITFKARENAEKYTEFVFMTEKLGEYVLKFRRQDLFTGEDSEQRVRVSVVTTEKFAEMLNIQKERAGTDAGISGPSPRGFIVADTFYNDEKYEEALREYVDNYVEGNSKVNHRIAELSFRFEDYSQAARFWRKNIHAENDTYREKAVAGLLRTAIRRNDTAEFDEMLPKITDLQRVPLAELLEEAAKFQIARGEKRSAVGLLDEYVNRYYGSYNSDWAYFTLGTLYEQAGPVRDLNKAKYYYRVVIQDFPASTYYEKAEERIQYINRNFLNVH